MRRTLVLAALSSAAALAAALSAHAQDVVGAAVVNGQEVEPLSDRTSGEAAPHPDGCSRVEGAIAFCGSRATGRLPASASPQVGAFHALDDRRFARIVHEATARSAGFDEEAIRRAVIRIAAEAMGIRPSRSPLPVIEEAEVGGRAAETLAHRVDLDGLPTVFVNTRTGGDARAVRAMIGELWETLTDAHQAPHADALAAVRVDADAP